MVKKLPGPNASSNKKIFHDGAYKIAASTKTDSIIIFRRQDSGKYKQADIVSATNNNYSAAVKRINRMHARDKSAAMIANNISRIAKAADEAVSPIRTKVPLERKVQEDLQNFAQSSFTLPSNIPNVSRTYLIRKAKKKIVGSKDTTLDATLYLVATYDLNKIINIDHFIGVGCVKKAIERARLDASLLKPAEIVVQTRGENWVGESASFSAKHVIYIGSKESVEHVQQGLTGAINKFFLKLTSKKP
jgi:hypothetical protein